MKLIYEVWETIHGEKMNLLGTFKTPEGAIGIARSYIKIHGNDNGSTRYEVIVTGWEDA